MSSTETGPGKRPAGPIARAGDSLAGAALFVMMAVTVIDVIGRYLFHRPLPASFELTEYLMGLLVFVAVPLAAAYDENISINLFDRFLSARLRRIRAVAFNALAAIVVTAIGWRVWLLAEQMRGYGDSTQTLRIPLAPLGYFIATSLALTAAVLAWRALRAVRGKADSGGGEWA